MPPDDTTLPILDIRHLTVAFGPAQRPVRAVNDASFTLEAGEILGIAGESGSGKTTLCSAVIRTLPLLARATGEALFDGRDLLRLPEREMSALRGREIAMVLQNPMTSLDPLFTIGNQIDEVRRERHVDLSAVELLRRVHLTAPELRLRQYPHQLSGGMRQRVLIAMATAAAPRLLIADEPTTALDASIQDEILLLFREIRDTAGCAIIIVTHDLGTIRRLCDRVIVMYAGRIVEEGPTGDIFRTPCHPYTKALLASLPRLVEDRVILQAIPGQVPNLAELPPGCAFADRCTLVQDRCRREQPEAVAVGARRRAFCWQAGADT
jgi:peptide/nickel transport system ATP-binding protein/oligopeptide transport system ATP-binding protein